jgi:pimeloyl-ACP methyl ester carboxylesterase
VGFLVEFELNVPERTPDSDVQARVSVEAAASANDPGASQAKGMEFLGRFMERKEGRDAPTSDTARDAQYDAVVEWGIPDHAALQRLTGIESPTLIIQGDDDLMIPTKLSHLMAGLIPDARIRIYPDSAHGFLFQYPIEVAAEINAFLANVDG